MEGVPAAQVLCVTGLEMDPVCLARAGSAEYQTKTLGKVSGKIKDKWFQRDRGACRLDPGIRKQSR